MTIDDNYEIPFGKFKGTKMCNIPAWYLQHIANKISHDKVGMRQSQLEKGIVKYVKDNKEILDNESKKGYILRKNISCSNCFSNNTYNLYKWV